MNAPFLKPWTQAQFFAWVAEQDGRWEFDGFRPVAMTGGTANHNLIGQNVIAALRQRLRGSGCRPFGSDMGIETIGAAVRSDGTGIAGGRHPAHAGTRHRNFGRRIL